MKGDIALQKARQWWLINEIKILKLLRPVAEISSKTGYGMSSVSEIINEKANVTPKFLRSFCEGFGYEYSAVEKELKDLIHISADISKGIIHVKNALKDGKMNDRNAIPSNPTKKEEEIMLAQVFELAQKNADTAAVNADTANILAKAHDKLANAITELIGLRSRRETLEGETKK